MFFRIESTDGNRRGPMMLRRYHDGIEAFLSQSKDEPTTLEESYAHLARIFAEEAPDP